MRTGKRRGFKIQLLFLFLLDKLGPTVFAPVKMDFVGNIKVTTITDFSFLNKIPTLDTSAQ